MGHSTAGSPQILVLDAGGQYCHMIARRIRDRGVSAEVCAISDVLDRLPGSRGVIISGGPRSVYDVDAPSCPLELFQAGLPILGICYGHQLMANALGGRVEATSNREYGAATLDLVDQDTIFTGLGLHERVWMSHGDAVQEVPPGFRILATTTDCAVAAMADTSRHLFGVQFHPEVSHTSCGSTILENFVSRICRCVRDFELAERVPNLLEETRAAVGSRKVLFFVSGGVDSTVAFALCTKALGAARTMGVFVDTGLSRKFDRQALELIAAERGWENLRIVDAQERFMTALTGIVDPEEKRAVIGQAFVDVQTDVLRDLEADPAGWVLGQGTIYPDTIESGGGSGAALIKTHHNRVPAIQAMQREGRVVEPLRSLYKDEVRRLGRAIGLPASMMDRHPFPGPGLAVRCICSAIEAPAESVPEVLKIASDQGCSAWTLPLRTVGVQGDNRTYHRLVVLVGEGDLGRFANAGARITRTVPGTNRVVGLLASTAEHSMRPMVRKATMTSERLETLREADAIVDDWLRTTGLIRDVWQFPVVLVPVSFGNGETIALRPVCSTDGMTAQHAELPIALVNELTERLLALPGVGAVVYDVTDKPPATIEWE